MSITRRETIALAVCGPVTIAAYVALAKSLPLPGVAGLVDARLDRSKNENFILLNMRDAGGYGHALMTWISQAGGARTTLSFGYYADAVGSIAEVFDTSGKLLDELAPPVDPSRETRLALVFWVDHDQYQAVLGRVDRWQGKGQYQLFRRDCVAFVGDMVAPLALKMPSRVLLPRPFDFVVALIEANAQHLDQ